MFLNPVFRRESRVRWRGWRGFALLFLYAMALCWVVGWSYATSAANNEINGSADLAESGRAMFRTVQFLQMLTWLLMVPILTSTIISSERERGLLEALQLSGLRSRQIVGGKIGAVLLFVVLIMLAGSPVTSLCFLLGALAPEEFIRSLALQAVTILLCAAIGLFYSARAPRSLGAVRNSLIAMLLFGIGTAFAMPIYFQLPFDGLGIVLSTQTDAFLQNIFGGLTLLNPMRAQMAVFDDYNTAYPDLAGQIWTSYDAFQFTLIALSVLALLFLWGATRAVKRVWDDPQWVERKRYLTFRNGRFTWREAQKQPTQWGNERLEEKQAAHSAGLAPTPTPRDVSLAVMDTPLAAFIHFRNPVLQREVRGKLRVRRYPKPVTLLMSALAVVGGIAYMYGIFWGWVEVNGRRDFWALCMFSSLLAVTIGVPVMSAGALTRERENGTWEMLELSLMEPRELLFGKVLAPLFFVAMLLVLLAPMLIPGVNYLDFSLVAQERYAAISLPKAVLIVLLLLSTSFCFAAWGLWLSWHFRATVTAMAVSLLSMIVILLVLPWLLITLFGGDNSADRSLGNFVSLWHPWVAIGEIFDASRPSNGTNVSVPGWWISWLFPATQTAFGLLLLSDLNRRIKNAWRLPHQSLLNFAARRSLPNQTQDEVQAA